MRKPFIVFLLLLVCGIVFAQKKKVRSTSAIRSSEVQETPFGNYEQCTNLHRYTTVQRRAFFPFGEALKIRLITYEGGAEPNPDIRVDEPGGPPMPEPIKLPIPPEDTMALFIPLRPNKFNVNYCRVFELRDLSAAGIDSLTDVLYNVGYMPVKNVRAYPVRGYSCYEPRNAILFLDEKERVTQYIEFCFGCRRYFYSSAKTTPVNYCEQKYDMLRAFFRGQGLNYGTGLHTEN